MAQGRPAASALKGRHAASATVESGCERGRSALVASGAVGALAGLTYASTVGHGFVWDDPISVHRWLPAVPTWWAAFFPPPNIPQFPADYYRPLQLLSYRVDRAIGGGAAWPFHLSVVLLHVLATVLVFRVGVRLFDRTPAGWRAALWAAALFAVHPIHSESVAWMAARPDVMVTCAGLAALLVYWNGSWGFGWRSSIAAAFIFTGLLCKENAAALLTMVPASLFVFPSLAPHRAAGAAARRGGPTRLTAASLLVTVLPFVVAGVAYMLLRVAALDRAQPAETVIPSNPLVAFVGAVGTYLRLLIVPYPQNAYIADIPTGVMAGAANGLAILAFVALLWWAWRRDERPLLFALVWVAVTLAPSLLVVIRPPTAPLAERYLYLPSVGFCWTVGALLARAGEGGRARQVVLQVGVVALVVLGAALTIRRNRVWHDNVRLWSDTAAKSPADGLPLRSLAAATLERGDAAGAERLFLQALELRNTTDGQFRIYNNLGTLALNRNDEVGAERYYQLALALDPSAADTLYNLGLMTLRRGTNAERTPDAAARVAHTRAARALFEQALATSPHDPDIHVGLGQAASALGDEPTARRHFEQALRLGLPAPTAAAVRRLLGQR